MRVEQAAEVALVDPKTIRRAIHRGELRALVSGRIIRIHRTALETWVMGGHRPQVSS
jgi:excisionase family DNA binding protein